MSLNGLPILPGQVLARDLNGHYFYVDATPDMVNNAMRLTQDLHASGQSRPKGDSATLADFLIECPADRSGPAFYRWATVNQLSPRKTIQLEIEASVHGMTFQPGVSMSRKQQPVDDDSDDQEGHTFHPGTTMADTAADPLQRQGVPLADDADPYPETNDEDDQPTPDPGDLDHMTMSPGVTLATLQKAGIVHSKMSQDEFDARLRRVKVDLSGRMRLAVEAMESGWFVRASAPTRQTTQYPIPGRAGGDSMGNPSYPTATIPSGRTMNAATLLQELRRQVAQLEAQVYGQRRSIHGRAVGC